MKRIDVNYIVSGLLLVSISITGMLGYLQAQFEFRKFIPHRYAAFVTLSLAAMHVYLNGSKLWKYFRQKFKKKR